MICIDWSRAASMTVQIGQIMAAICKSSAVAKTRDAQAQMPARTEKLPPV